MFAFIEFAFVIALTIVIYYTLTELYVEYCLYCMHIIFAYWHLIQYTNRIISVTFHWFHLNLKKNLVYNVGPKMC